MDVEALLESIGFEPEPEGPPVSPGLPGERPRSFEDQAFSAEKIRELESRLTDDFGLNVQIAALISPPITEDKIRQFLLASRNEYA